jgi:hypothetical protein
LIAYLLLVWKSIIELLVVYGLGGQELIIDALRSLRLIVDPSIFDALHARVRIIP